TLLERVRRGVEDAIAKRPAIIRSLFAKSRAAWQRLHVGRGRVNDTFWLRLGRALIFRKIRGRFGPRLRALLCGSAPLAPETQQFFLMLGIPVLQAYGLTETTGICTLDDPRVPVEPGYVGAAITGIEMKLAENEEIVVRGPTFSRAIGIARKKLHAYCKTDGSTRAIKAKSTFAEIGASVAASRI